MIGTHLIEIQITYVILRDIDVNDFDVFERLVGFVDAHVLDGVDHF